MLWELSFCYVGDGDPEAVLLFSLSLSALLFMRAVLLTLEVRSVFLFMDALLVMGTVLWPLRLMLSFPFCGCSLRSEDGDVALEVISDFPFVRVMLPLA